MSRGILQDQRVGIVRNVVRNTFTEPTNVNLSSMGSASGLTFTFDTSMKLFGNSSGRRVRNSGTGNFAGMKGHLLPYAQLGAKAGDIIRWAIWVRHDNPTNIVLNPYHESIGGTYSGGSGGAGVSVPPNTWVRVTGQWAITQISLDNNTGRGVGVLTTGSNAEIGSQFWWNGLMATFNAPLPEVHCDGNTPGWKWSGAVGASDSLGRPYTIQSLVGNPLGDLEGVGRIALAGGDPLVPLTLFHVYDAAAPTAQWTATAYVQSNNGSTPDWNAGALSFGRRNQGDFTYNHYRLSTGAANNLAAAGTGGTPGTRGWTQGRHVVAITVDFLPMIITTTQDALEDYVMSSYMGQSGTGVPRNYLGTGSDVNGQPVRTILFNRSMDRSQRLAVNVWLANKYGVTL